MSNLPSFTRKSKDEVTVVNGTEQHDASVTSYGTILKTKDAITPWLDTKSFPIVQLTTSLTDASVAVFWGIGDGDDIPDGRALASDVVSDSGTTELDCRTRWARIHLRGSDNNNRVSYSFKPSATSIKVVDDSGSIVSITSNAMNIVYRDASGTLGSTDSGETTVGNALYTSLTDSCGQPLATVLMDTLAVALRDNCGSNLSSTGTSGNVLLTQTYDRPVFDLVFFLDQKTITTGNIDATENVQNVSSITFSAADVATNAITGLTNIKQGGSDSTIDIIKPGYIIANNDDLYVTSVGSDDLSLNGTPTESPDFQIDSQTKISHYVYNVISPTLDYVDYWETATVSGMRTAFVGPDLSIDYVATKAGLMDRLEASMSTMVNATTTTNNLYDYINTFGAAGFSHVASRERRAVALVYSDVQSGTLGTETSFSQVSVTALESGINNVDGLAQVRYSGEDVSAYITTDGSTGTINIVFGDYYTANNALATVTTDICGHAQAAGEDVQSAAKFGHVALSYALADISGVPIGSTNTYNNSQNALYVHLTDASGISHSSTNEVPIDVGGDTTVGLMLDTSLGDTMVSLVQISNTDVSGHSFNLNSIGLCNESPVPVWFKIYDAHNGMALHAEQTGDYSEVQGAMKFNIAVPPLNIRDVRFEKGMVFDHGICARASTKHSYDASSDALVGGNQAYLSAHYAKVLTESSRLQTSTNNRPVPTGDRTRIFDICDNTIQIKGWITYVPGTSNDTAVVSLTKAVGVTGFTSDVSSEFRDLNNTQLASTVTEHGTLKVEPELPVDSYTVTITETTNASALSYNILLDADTSYEVPIVTGIRSSDTRFASYGANKVLSAYVVDSSATFQAVNVGTGFSLTTAADISQVDVFLSSDNLANAAGDVSRNMANAPSQDTSTTVVATSLDSSVYFITADASVHILSLHDNQYTVSLGQSGDPGDNRTEYFGISAGHVDGSNWCFSTQRFAGYVTVCGDGTQYHQAIVARYDKEASGVPTINVSFWQDATADYAISSSGTFTDSNSQINSYYRSTDAYGVANRVQITWDGADFSGGYDATQDGTRFIYM